MNKNTPVLEWDNVTIAAGGNTIISDFTLSIEPGEKVLLYGPSGTGKSSIVKAILGFIPVTAGEIRYRGNRVSKKTVWEIRKNIAYIPQNTDLGDGTVREIINTLFSYKSNGPAPSSDEITAVMDQFDLSHEFLEKEFQTLSGGEKQRIAITAALLLKRPVFFLDEVTASLDAELKKRVISSFLDMEQSTLCVISHDPDWLSSGKLRVIDIYGTTPRNKGPK